MQIAAEDCDVSLGEGGLLRRVESLFHLTRPQWQIVVALVVTWVPVVVLGLMNEHTLGRELTLLRDPAMHVRLLVATPVLLALDYLFPRTCRFALAQLLRYGVIPRAKLPRFDQTMQRARRLGDWWLPEVLILLCALGLSIAGLLELVPLHRLEPGRSEAQIWYALVALPLFEFLLLRSLWRWALWVYVLIRLARTELDLEPTHPDRRGGISFLRFPSLSYCSALLFATSSVLCAEWYNRFPTKVTVEGFAPLLLAFALIGSLLAFGPLLLFVGQLALAKRDGQTLVGSAAAGAGRWFRTRWLDPASAEIVTTQDVQSLAAVISTYRDTVGQLRLVVFERLDLMIVLAATLAPVVPLMVIRIPREDWFALMGSFTGGMPPL